VTELPSGTVTFLLHGHRGLYAFAQGASRALRQVTRRARKDHARRVRGSRWPGSRHAGRSGRRRSDERLPAPAQRRRRGCRARAWKGACIDAQVKRLAAAGARSQRRSNARREDRPRTRQSGALGAAVHAALRRLRLQPSRELSAEPLRLELGPARSTLGSLISTRVGRALGFAESRFRADVVVGRHGTLWADRAARSARPGTASRNARRVRGCCRGRARGRSVESAPSASRVQPAPPRRGRRAPRRTPRTRPGR